MKKMLLALSLFATTSLSLAAPPAPALGGNITTTFNALDLQDRPMVLKMHQGETWQLDLPDGVAKIISGRDDQLDVQVDSNVVFLKAIQNTGWGNLTIRLKNGDSIQVVYSLASASGRYIRRVVVEYPADPELTEAPVQAARPVYSTPTTTVPAVTTTRTSAAPVPTPAVPVATGPQVAPDWLRFGFTGGTRNGNSLTLGYRITNIGTETIVFNPQAVRMQSGAQALKVAVLGDQNGTVRVNAGQTVYGSLVVDTAGSVANAPVTWSWIGSTVNGARQYDVGGPLTLVLAGAGHAGR
ncbi:hypothetical protein V3W47_08515 [Deinococcus sp. YIM 134068]|uniref:hypothetical protein n=1 Tax=Deinococcus lichenicola TaxID=3118910 RepID=UPI002F92C114